MTKEEIVGQVLLKLTGGSPSTDSSVWLTDIDSLIAPAVNFVQIGQYWADKNDEGERNIQHFMLQTYGANKELSIVEDPIRRRYFFGLPRRPLSLPNGRALQFVGDLYGRGFIPLSQGSEDLQDHYNKFKKNVTSYRPEGLRVYLWNKRESDNYALVKMLVNVSDMYSTDEIVLPSGGEIQVINLIYEWLSGQRSTPKDIVIDQKDKVTQ